MDNSPSPLAMTNHKQEIQTSCDHLLVGCKMDTNVDSSPESTCSIKSTTLMCKYGKDVAYDMNLEFHIESVLGRTIAYEEVMACMSSFVGAHGRPPMLRELLLELGGEHNHQDENDGVSPSSPPGEGSGSLAAPQHGVLNSQFPLNTCGTQQWHFGTISPAPMHGLGSPCSANGCSSDATCAEAATPADSEFGDNMPSRQQVTIPSLNLRKVNSLAQGGQTSDARIVPPADMMSSPSSVIRTDPVDMLKTLLPSAMKHRRLSLDCDLRDTPYKATAAPSTSSPADLRSDVSIPGFISHLSDGDDLLQHDLYSGPMQQPQLVESGSNGLEQPSTRPIVPKLALGPQVVQQMCETTGSGPRTCRLSGHSTRRRMVEGATSGVTSHALGTAFWAESEDESEPYDSSSEVADGGPPHDDLFGFLHIEAHGTLGNISESPPAASPVWDSTPVAKLGKCRSERLCSSSACTPCAPEQGSYTDTDRGRRLRRADSCRAAVSSAHKTPDSPELVLPEELWNLIEQLRDSPNGRRHRMLQSLTNVERIKCTTYSTVSKADHEEQRVVVKVYDVTEREKLANAFAEVAVLQQLSEWSGAVKLLDFGRNGDNVMLMLESCDHTLKDWCNSKRFEDGSTGASFIIGCLRLFCKLAELVAELHERWHIAHCDLKPDNILLMSGELKVADFSESMLFNGKPRLVNQARGTVPYQPPEMVHGHCVDARKADVWAMGCILYEMITGEMLFRGGSDVMRAIMAGGSAARQLSHYQRLLSRNRSMRQDEAQQLQGCSPLPASRSPGGLASLQPDMGSGLPTNGEAGHGQSQGGESVVGNGPPVPRLPLGLARPPIPAAPKPANGVPSLPFGQLQQLALPPHLLSSRSGQATTTARSLGYGADDAASLASDPWGPVSAVNTAPNTARTTARTTARDTARSAASTCTAVAWPPPPPPSAGTSRSVAESEWTLALPASGLMVAASVGEGISGRTSHGGSDAAGPRGLSGCGSLTAPSLPPHRRLRHSVPTQCADPAGPDWFSTEEADRMRMMCEEQPSFIAAQHDRPRLLSGADGPSLCDDLLGLLRTVLVEDFARPSMHQVAVLASEVLNRHSNTTPSLEADRVEEGAAAASTDVMADEHGGAFSMEAYTPYMRDTDGGGESAGSRNRNVFEVCEPLLTSRESMSSPCRGWKRLMEAKPEKEGS